MLESIMCIVVGLLLLSAVVWAVLKLYGPVSCCHVGGFPRDSDDNSEQDQTKEAK